MHIVLIDQGGREQEALLLASALERMRLMMPGRADADELRLVDGIWRGENGAALEIAAVMPLGGEMCVPAEEPLKAHAGVAF